MIPERRIVTPKDLEKWVDSPLYNKLVDFTVALQTLAQGHENNQPAHDGNAACHLLLNALNQVDAAIDNHPVVKDAELLRFGKPEFREFYDDIHSQSITLMQAVVGPEHAEEVATYFGEAFGNRTRIDYGSGHELNFLLVMVAMDTVKAITADDYLYLAVVVFPRYIKVMRRLQRVYWLEPAGLHGVWGLDDYHFLPFLLGAGQLAPHPHMKPKLIHNKELVEMYATRYMYFECIDFVNHIKTIPNHQGELLLRWHLPMLDDISAAKLWSKINDGMIKMYKAEVLGKLPIIQHFMFGSLIPAPEGVSQPHEHAVDDNCGHVHDAVNTWGDCCGIKIPSAIAASESMKQRPLPFD